MDVHLDVNQKVEKVERPDKSALQESCLELPREEHSSVLLHHEDQHTWYVHNS